MEDLNQKWKQDPPPHQIGRLCHSSTFFNLSNFLYRTSHLGTHRKPPVLNQTFPEETASVIICWPSFGPHLVLVKKMESKTFLFYSILFYSILFYSILSYSILFYSILFYSILFYYILFYYILIYFILSYSIPYHSILSYSIVTVYSILLF